MTLKCIRKSTFLFLLPRKKTDELQGPFPTFFAKTGDICIACSENILTHDFSSLRPLSKEFFFVRSLATLSISQVL
jgi:hypothetical protein